MAIQDFRVQEVVVSVGADPSIRYVQLHVPGDPASADNCLFPSSQIQIYDAAGNLLGADAAVMVTTCLPGDSDFLFATAAAGAYFGVAPDARLDVAIPADAGQICFASTLTRYDCVRWGAVTNPITDFDSAADTTDAPPIPDGLALTRIADTGVVANDFVIESSRFHHPDAGPNPPDAAPHPDAILSDASTADRFVPPVVPDAGPPPAWLTAEPGGGGCAVGDRRVAGWPLLLLGLAWLSCRASRR